MGDGLERGLGLGVAKGNVGEALTIETSGAVQHIRAESLGDSLQGGSARFDDRPGNLVGVDHDGPTGRQHLRHR